MEIALILVNLIFSVRDLEQSQSLTSSKDLQVDIIVRNHTLAKIKTDKWLLLAEKDPFALNDETRT